MPLSLHPDEATPSNSWGNLLYLLGEPVAVAAGQEWALQYEHRRGSRFGLTPQVGGGWPRTQETTPPAAAQLTERSSLASTDQPGEVPR